MLVNSTFDQIFQKTPMFFVEVGARGGMPEYWKKYRDYISVIGFEPDRRSFNELKQSDRHLIIPVGLDNKKGELTLYQTKKEGVSSTLKPNHKVLQQFAIEHWFEVVGQSTIQVDTLDHQLTKYDLTNIDFIQVDTQGTELSVLEGADEALRRNVLGVEVEVGFVHFYENQALFADIDHFMRSYGFELLDLRRNFLKRKAGLNIGGGQGQLLAGDALYLRSPENLKCFLEKIFDPEEKKIKLYHSLLICLVYGYFDLAYDYIDHNEEMIGKKTANDLKRDLYLITPLRSRIPDFWGRGRIARYLRIAGEKLRPPNRYGRLRDKLGNAQVDL